MNTRNQLLCAHSTVVFVLFTLGGLLVLAGWVPPPSPALDAEQTAAVFANDTQLRIGLAIIAFVAPLFMGLAMAIAAQLRRIEGPFHVMSGLQLLMAAVGVLALQFPCLAWLGISYRGGVSPEIMQVFNDVCWFIFLGAVSPAVFQPLAIGLCILGSESSEEVYPRWLGYGNLWLAFLLVPGVLIPFFVTGPFAWDGLFSFWLALNVFFLWMILNYVYTVKAIRAQQVGEQQRGWDRVGVSGTVEHQGARA
ncbi:MAG: hypothetical protein ACRERD_26545 [Candidatus Binatia bacterium]